MLGTSPLKELFGNVLETKFVNKIYHSVVLKPSKEPGMKKPTAPVAGRFIYVGLDDTKGFSCYCRQTGPMEVQKTELIGCSKKIYTFQILHRLVFFHDVEKRSHEDITAKIVQAIVKTPFITMQKAITLPEAILQIEVPNGNFYFKELTYYAAFEFYVLLKLHADNCTAEIACEGIKNPYYL